MLLRTVAHRNMSTTRLYCYYRGKTNSYRGENFYRYIANAKTSPIPSGSCDPPHGKYCSFDLGLGTKDYLSHNEVLARLQFGMPVVTWHM